MTESKLPAPHESDLLLPKKRMGFLSRILKYALSRAAGLGLMLVVGMFVAVVVLNFGGYIDAIYEANIDDVIRSTSYNQPAFREMSHEEFLQAVAELRWQLEEMYGLHTPFLVRCAHWTYQALVLNIGDYGVDITDMFFMPRPPSATIRMIFLQRLPYTLLLFGVSNLLFFFASLFMALFLFRRYESFLDKLFIFLSPISSIPNWVFGVFLVILFAAVLQILPFPRRLTEGISWYVSANPLYFFKYMILPVLAIFLNMFFQSVYSWRTFFLLQAGEDFIELAKAKGLSDRVIQRRYLVRPTLPYIITNFAMTMLGIWQAAFILEKFFFWPGIGSLFFDSINSPSVTIGIIVIFAYLLVFTIFLLDILYALVDPRVRVGAQNGGTLERGSSQPLLRRLKRAFAIRQPLHMERPAARLTPLPKEESSLEQRVRLRRQRFSTWRAALREIRRYPSAIFGLVIIALLILVSIYTVIAHPYGETLLLWRGDGGIWENNPAFAQPAWSNFFRAEKLPETIVLDSRDGTAEKQVELAGQGMWRVTILFPIDYPYAGYPQDLVVNIDAVNVERAPYVSLTWIAPDGRETVLDTFISTSEHRYSFNWNYYYERQNLLEIRSGPPPWEDLFVPSGVAGGEVQQGRYQLRLESFVFDERTEVDAELVLYGRVHGLAGTDDRGRDLTLALLWGTPFSLAFGLLGAFGTGLLAMGFAAVAVWLGGWADGLIQRITEINMLLPALPIAIMIYFVYTHNIWVVLGIIILLSVFGNALKNYRAAFLQFRDAGYIQAAQVYGAGNFRIILKYLVPRIVPLLVPQLVALVPSYIFLEPTLAFVGVADPFLPTWGKILMTALYVAEENNQIFYLNLMHNPYLAVEPLLLMFVTGLAFSLLGMALDRIFNPRLRSL